MKNDSWQNSSTLNKSLFDSFEDIFYIFVHNFYFWGEVELMRSDDIVVHI